MKNTKTKLPVRIKINIGIFFALAVFFAFLPNVLPGIFLPSNNSQLYEGGFSYILHDICPCHAGDDDCSGYYACGLDKANITYNLDTAPADLLAEAKRDQYFEDRIESSRQSYVALRLLLLNDISYLMTFISLIAGIIYWNHNMVKK